MRHIKENLDDFLDSEFAGVIAIKGDWGAGKTYFVSHFLKEKGVLRSKLISFVSLFGLSSIDDVKRQILPSAISAKALCDGKESSHFKKLLGLARKLPKVADFEQIFQSVEDHMTRDLLVVFDDIERKEKEFSLKSFLGLVNYLAEHADCKVIVILNEAELSDVDKEELGRFREKLLDREILFAPTYEDNAKLFFHDKQLFGDAVTIFKKCECRNLRIIKKCHVNVSAFRERFPKLAKTQKVRLLQQVVILSCLFYQRGAEIDFDALSSYAIYSMLPDKDQESERRKGFELLKQVGYFPSDYDQVIISYLKAGCFDFDEVKRVRFNESRNVVSERIRQKLWKSYEALDGNFHGDRESIIRELTSTLETQIGKLSPTDVVETVKRLEILGVQGAIKKWTDAFVTHRASRMTFDECEQFSPWASSELSKQAIERRKREIFTSRSLKDIVYSIANHEGWNREDIIALNEYSVDEYAKWFTEETDRNLLNSLREFIKSFSPKVEEPEFRAVGKKVFEAFARIANNSDLIELKLKNYVGVTPEVLKEFQRSPLRSGKV